MLLKFDKYSGCGNDFILIDNRAQIFPTDNPALVQKLCQRGVGVGADGVLLLENSAHSDFRMRIFNADGTEAEMCGNGIRCLMKFIQAHGEQKRTCTIETFLSSLQVSLVGENVSVEMGPPSDLRLNIPVSIDGIDYTVHSVNTGVPHVVLFVEHGLETFDLHGLGSKMRHHPLFAPQGANFNVAELRPEGIVWNRTFERGVEGETLACGTGCAAVAIVAHRLMGVPSPITVRTHSGETLQIHFNESVGRVTLSGPATKIFSGELDLPHSFS